jgi:plasmid replication initiation protein
MLRNIKTGKTGIVRSRWVSRVFYVDTLAILEITFAPDVVPLVTRQRNTLQVINLNRYHSLQVSMQFDYELLIAWREVGKTPQIELSEFRNRLVLRIMNINVWSCLKGVS